MICKKCGTEVSDTLKFCPSCGSSLEEVSSTFPGINTNNIFNNMQGVNTVEQTPSVINETPVVVPTPIETPAQPTVNPTPVVTPSIEPTPVVTPTVQPTTPVSTPMVGNINPTPVVTEPVQPTMGPAANIPGPISNFQPVSQPINTFGQNTYGNQPYTPQNDNKKNTGLILVIVGIVVAVIVCIIIIANTGDKSNSSNSNSNVPSITSNSNSNYTPTSNSVSNTTSNVTSNVTSNTTPTTGNTVTFKGFVFQVPSTYTVSSSTSQLQLLGKNNRDVAVINIQDGNYDTIKGSSSTIQAYMKNAGYDVTNIKTNNYSGIEFITAEVDQGGKKMILAYSKLATNKIFMIVTANTSYTIDYSPLNYFGTMVATAKAA